MQNMLAPYLTTDHISLATQYPSSFQVAAVPPTSLLPGGIYGRDQDTTSLNPTQVQQTLSASRDEYFILQKNLCENDATRPQNSQQKH